MKYKIAQPEDYTGEENYSFKLSKAYAKTYADMLEVLCALDMCVNALKSDDQIEIEVAGCLSEQTLNKYKT